MISASAKLLALCAFACGDATTTAFVVPAPRKSNARSVSTLHQSSTGTGTGTGTNESFSNPIPPSRGGSSSSNIFPSSQKRDPFQPFSSGDRFETVFSSSSETSQPLGALPPGGGMYSMDPQFQKNVQQIQAFDSFDTVQGNTLKTWSFANSNLQRTLIALRNEEGRHIEAQIELCQGPDNTPQRMDIAIGKGMLRPFFCVVETPGGNSAVFLRNMGPLEYPIQASIGAEIASDVWNGSTEPTADGILPPSAHSSLYDMGEEPTLLQGGSVVSYKYGSDVLSVKVVLQTNGTPLNARVELLQGPNTNKQVMEVYTENGVARPFFTIVATPGSDNTLRIVNTATLEFPIVAHIEPYLVDPSLPASSKQTKV